MGPDGPTGNDPAAPSAQHAPAEGAPQDSAVTKTVDEGFVSSKPLLMIGAAGDAVAELGHLLAGHGFANAISEGKAAAPPILNDALMQVVKSFQEANGLNPWKAENDQGAPTLSSNHIGCVDARTWEALLGYQPTVVAQGAQA